MIFLSFVENFCFSWRWSRRMSISSSLGITSLTGTGLAKGAFWSRCQDFSRNAKGQHFTTNISYSITWCQVLLDRFDWFWHVWNLDLEPHWSQGWLCHVSNQFVLCELTFISITWSWSTVNYISFPPQEQIPKVGERGLGWAWRAVRPSQLWCVQVKKVTNKAFAHVWIKIQFKSSGSGSRKAVTRMVRD